MSLVRCSVRCGHVGRSFSTTSSVRNDQETKTAPAPSRPAKSAGPARLSKNAQDHTQRKAFIKWIMTEGGQFAAQPVETGTNYLNGRDYPFPLNPQFRPRTPTSDRVRANIYEDWTKGLGLQQASAKYGLSLYRIEGILRLGEVKRRWLKDDKPLLSSYSARMEAMLGVSDKSVPEYEVKINVPIDPGRQVYKLIPENQEYTSVDAARDLGKAPVAERTRQRITTFVEKSRFDRGTRYARMIKQNKPEDVTVESSKPDAKYNYTFKDTSSQTTMIRKLDGDLMIKAKKGAKPSKWFS